MWEMTIMKPYLLSLGAGLVVGIVYSLLNVRSPAPPVIALVGLFGILAGEQIVPLAKRLIASQDISASTIQEYCGAHMFGRLPGRCRGSTADIAVKPPAASDS
jgi:XapX domain-containing protein